LDRETAKQKLQTLAGGEKLNLTLDFIRRPWSTLSSRTIYMPNDFLQKSDDWIAGWMLHEIEHRKSSPGPIENLLVWVYKVVDCGVREPGKLLHFYSDLVIDQDLHRSRKTEYEVFLRERQPSLDYLDEPNLELYLAVQSRITEPSLTTSEKGSRVYEITFSEGKGHENRVRELANYLKEDFQGGSPFMLDVPPGLELTYEERDRTVRQLLYSGATPAQIEDFLDRLRLGLTENQRRQLLSSAKKLYLYQLVQLVSPVLRGLRTADFPIFEIWGPGDDPRELSLIDTMRIFGMLVPGVFAIKRRELVRGRRAKSVVILMDCSGSAGLNMTIGREREAAFGLIQAAREYGDIVSFVPFSTEVRFDQSVLYSKDYDEVEDAVIKVEPGGYSNIASALSMALRVGDMAGRQMVFAMTDGRVWDSDEAVGLINKLTEYGKVVFFIFGTGVRGMDEEAKSLLRGSIVYECNPKEPMIDQALQEYLG
jgi:hypothetical protein